ncbi:MAG: Bug family tripartite tricarboxylate transporter substrate binding protein [Betaproteobacteria bacterium]
MRNPGIDTARRLVRHFAAFLLLMPALALGYPTKPITLVVPFNAGSAPDSTFRVLADEAEKAIGQKMIILNRPGPGGTVGVTEVARAAPDGYTIGMAAVAILALQPLLQELPFKGPGDVALVAQTNEAPMALAVSAESPWRKLDEFLAEAKRRPGQVSVGLGGGFHTILHVELALLEKSAGVRFNVVPFNAGAQLPAVLGGTIDSGLGQTALFAPHVRSGKMRLLGQFGETRVSDAPTFKEQGHDITVIPYEFVVAPKGTPAPAIDRLAAAFRAATESAAFRDYAKKRGLIVSYLGPAELARRLAADANLYRQVVEEFGWKKK